MNCLGIQLSLCQPYPYKFNYLTVDEGLSHTDANDIAQDEQGYIWIATYFGLNRYDGYSLKKFYNKDLPVNNAFRNRITCLYPDGSGNIWLGTEDGLQCFYTKLEKYIDFKDPRNKANSIFQKLYKPAGNLLYGLNGTQLRLYLISDTSAEEQQLPAPANVQFSDMTPDKKGMLYLTSNKGVWRLNNKKFEKVHITGVSGEYFSKIFFDKQGNLLLASGNKLYLISIKPGSAGSSISQSMNVTKQFVCPDDSYIINMTEDNNYNYWVNTGTGLIRLNHNLSFVQTISNRSYLHSLQSNSINKIFIDRSQCLWVCTFGGGVNYCDLNEKLFYTLQHNPENANSLSGNHIRSVLEDGDSLWVGTQAEGLNLYNIKTQTFIHYNTHTSPVTLKSDIISSLTFDDDHNLWIGSAAGIEILKPGGKELWKPQGYNQFPTYIIETLAKDCYGNIWFGNHVNQFGVIWKDNQNNYHVNYYDEGYFILPDKNKPQLFVSSTHGLKRIKVDAKGNITETFTYQATSDPNSLSSNYTYPVCKQNDSTYWIGTMGGGLNRLSLQTKNNSYNVKSYTGDYGIFNDVESLEIDSNGNIWIGGNGLECLHPKTGALVKYDKNDGLQGNSFKVGSSYKGADGRLYFGGINGLNYFYPDQIKTNRIEARPVFTDILINNKLPHLGNSDSFQNSISQAISYCKNLNLSYRQNNFVIYFSAMHFANPLKCRYRYKLTGFDKNWRYTDGSHSSAAYSNLDYNNYRFVVEATNNDGVWSKNAAQITIIITPPWWKSDVAKTIYALLIVSALLGIYFYQARWYRLKREIAIRRIDEEKREEMHRHQEELYQQQLVFFTNVSHEFRTPLTLILGPLENLINQNKDAALTHSYQLMQKNAKRLMNLISELMNFKKVSDSVVKLRVQPVIINQFCKNLALEFQNLAISKDIDFKMIDSVDANPNLPVTGLFDSQILEKILFNLLSNAFKYTGINGQISFEVFFDMKSFRASFHNRFQLLYEAHRAERYIYFRIADSGIGISKESITRIFDRYYRISKNHLGSGVGLALVKSLTQLHKGDIYVYSERYKGTEIIIGIPWGEDNYDNLEKTALQAEPEAQLEVVDNATLLPLPVTKNNITPVDYKTNKHILLVDDNQELRNFLKGAFEKQYHIYEAQDGNAALETAKEKVPDVIISDVMMPGMNGIELCKICKQTFETSHIPFIILSAKDALDTKIEGMESGADFYFSKPLSIDLLLLTVHNIFEQSEKLKQRYNNNYLAEATELVQSEKDKEFLQELLHIIDENIEDAELDVEFLCKQLHISRTKLYQKIKSISNQSVGEFIRTIRLKKAVYLMTHEGVSIGEVVDKIGMQSSSNFSRAFKKEFGQSPMQFMQALKKK